MNLNKKSLFMSLALTVTIGTNVVTFVKYENKVEAMNKTIEGKQQDIDGLKNDKESLMDQIYNKNNQLEKQQGEIENLKNDKYKLNKNNEELKKEIKNKDSEIHRLNEKIKTDQKRNVVNISNTGNSKVESNNSPKQESKNSVSEQTVSSGNVDYYEVTAYTAGPESTGKSPGHPDYGKTTSGAYVQDGVTIACPSNIPFGTKIKIEGVGTRTCQDRGGKITSGKLDVYMPNLNDAQYFGRKKLKVEILN